MRAMGLAVWMLVLAACVAEETVEPPAGDTAGSGASDTSDTSGNDTADTTADTAVDDTADTAVDDTADTSVDDTADTSVDDTSDTSVDETADTSVDDTADTNLDDTTDTNVDDTNVDVEACLFGCGVGCPAPEFQICGTDGNLYCNSCYMGCLGIAPASQRSVCDPCGVYDAATALPYRLWLTPDSCMMSFDSGTSFSVATTEAELRAMLPCMDPATAITGIDWSIEVVAQVTQAYNPALTVQGVFSTPTGVAVATRSPVYCGGAAPPTSAAFFIVAAGSVGLHQESCLDGECSGGPFP
ncbi:MAG: hypothetical protein HQ461_12030 [Deltaproteobacteria bacterium]|nr:hypothetical protein [Deltaproteobacteria bacterium]